ncbi:MAG: peptidoglycan -binding protein [Rhodospirillales bacterium]|nr:peptidoglycan -binding protein [Rhodospirillales bacterium]
MPLRSRRRADDALSPWPGYVDALSTLLMVIIFVLLVFVLAQAFLSVALSRRDQALDQVNRKLAAMSSLLSLEQGRAHTLSLSVASLTGQLKDAATARDALAAQLSALQASDAATKAERDKLQAEFSDSQTKLAAAVAAAQAATGETGLVSGKLSDTEAQLADLASQVRSLTALRDQLQKQALDAAVHATTEAERRAALAAELNKEKALGDSATAQIALLNQQVDQLHAQLAALSQALDLQTAAGRDKDAQIANLGQKLNAALAAKVEELQQYRSEFFGRLRKVLAGQKGIAIVGDRFVIQSEILFPSGSAALTPEGVQEMGKLAGTILQIAKDIPPKLHWILRVDGHADKQKIVGGQFASNWDLSAARAINVVHLLIADGVPPEHLAAAAFSSYQPIDPANTPAAYAKNRRIELRLTD